MANSKYVYQQTRNTSIPKDDLIRIAEDQELSKTDYRVMILLFSKLRGWNSGDKAVDPLNFAKVSVENISDSLDISKDKVKESINNLEKYGYIEKGSSETVKNGWRFTF